MSLLVAMACGLAAGCRVQPPATVDTVVLVSIDSLRADHVGTFGYTAPTTPTIDALAARGIAYTRAYSTTSWTLPAHVAMLTGLDNIAHGVVQDGLAISGSIQTVAEAAAAADVETLGVFSGPYLQPVYGFSRGFRSYRDCSGLGDVERTGFGWTKDESMRAKSLVVETSSCVRAEVRRWAQEKHLGDKRFVFIHLWDVHFDYVPPPGYVELFDPDYSGTTYFGNLTFNPAIAPGMSARDLRHLIALYDGEIRYVDQTLAGILEDLRDADVTRNAAIIVTADHGEEFFEHGGKTHRIHLYDEVLRVPLVIAFTSGRPIGQRVNDVVSLIDIAPTVCALLDIRCRDMRPGQNLLALLDQRSPDRGDALAELGGGVKAYIRGNAKAITQGPSIVGVYEPPDFPGPEHHSIRVDLSRHEGATSSEAALVNSMLDRVQQASEAGIRLRGGAPSPTAEIDDATRRRLEALGYLKAPPAVKQP